MKKYTWIYHGFDDIDYKFEDLRDLSKQAFEDRRRFNFKRWPAYYTLYNYTVKHQYSPIFHELIERIEAVPIRHITCSNCGKLISMGRKVYHVDGVVYHCCSAHCLLDLLYNMHCTTLSEESAEDYEWELEE